MLPFLPAEHCTHLRVTSLVPLVVAFAAGTWLNCYTCVKSFIFIILPLECALNRKENKLLLLPLKCRNFSKWFLLKMRSTAWRRTPATGVEESFPSTTAAAMAIKKHFILQPASVGRKTRRETEGKTNGATTIRSK